MACVDRTAEFFSISEQLVLSRVVQPVARGPRQVTSEYNVVTAELGTEINRVQLKLQELRKLSKAKGLYNDKTAQIEEMQSVIKQDITSLNAKLEALERSMRSGANQQSRAHLENITGTLKNRMLEVTKEFKDVLMLRSKALQAQSDRMPMYSSNFGEFGENADPELGGAAQATMYHNSRAESVQSVQRMIGELGTIFQKMSVMVRAQDEFVQRIDQTVDDTLTNITEGHNELLQYFHNMSSNRWLILKVFGILLFFIVFFVLFLA